MTFEVNINTQIIIDLMNENTQLKILLHETRTYIEESKVKCSEADKALGMIAKITQALYGFALPEAISHSS